jgi:hypothetical protein
VYLKVVIAAIRDIPAARLRMNRDAKMPQAFIQLPVPGWWMEETRPMPEIAGDFPDSLELKIYIQRYISSTFQLF